MKNFVVTRALLAMFLVLAEYSAAQKLGLCPDFAGQKVACVEECGDDSQCLGDQRCCSNGCGHVCITPTEVLVATVLRGKPGLCPFMPRVHLLCLANAEMRCITDRDCPCDQKCCDVHCGRSCVNPLLGVVKVGQCPPVSITNVSVVSSSELDQCSNDVHCPQCRKCCFTRRGRQCTPPMPGTVPKVGVCPFVNTRSILCVEARDRCFDDNQCPCTQKCCTALCGRHCIDAPREIVKKGVCPFVDTSVIRCGKPIVNCLSDNDCPCDLKCCNMGCERRCIGPVSVPKAGACPFASPIALQCLRFDQQCRSDDDCSDELKCCDVPCGSRCLAPREVRPGSCPKARIPDTTVCYRECQADDDCSQPLKCCESGCSLGCLMPQLAP
ncbi:uncharacterized protein LOC116950791 isoform X1 [Petromyzon marinus]|uniref:uncharacterized protein LOC116950791 isoform X1 n=1 Tax=Petromyzon marinus TaxID=7757 RepID=UPI003F730EFD